MGMELFENITGASLQLYLLCSIELNKYSFPGSEFANKMSWETIKKETAQR